MSTKGERNESGSGATGFTLGLARILGEIRSSWRADFRPATPQQAMIAAHAADVARYEQETFLFRKRTARARRAARVWTTMAVTAATAAAATATVGGPDAMFGVGVPVAVYSGVFAVVYSRRARTAVPPLPPSTPPPPPEPLPDGVIGATDSRRLERIRIQLTRLLPSIDAIHTQAASELRGADREAAPALGALVERLRSLHGVMDEMAGTPASETAHRSALQLSARLKEGADMYEDLLGASLELMSAPDPHELTSTRLHHAVTELTAYSAGVRVAANFQDPLG